jgi:hypothetical protein
MFFKPKNKFEIFCNSTAPQSEHDFINDCFGDPSSAQLDIALAIRSSIADLGRVENNYIRSDLSFDNLRPLPIWEFDSFKTELLVSSIELKLKTNFTEKQLELAPVRNPDVHPDMKVREFIIEFYSWCDSLGFVDLCLSYGDSSREYSDFDCKS